MTFPIYGKTNIHVPNHQQSLNGNATHLSWEKCGI
jgi:hypothetical protein